MKTRNQIVSIGKWDDITKTIDLCIECLHWKGKYHCRKTQKTLDIRCLCEGIVCSKCGGNRRPFPGKYFWSIQEEIPENYYSRMIAVPSRCCRKKMIQVIDS